MKTMIEKFCVAALVACVGLTLASEGYAQSGTKGFGTTQADLLRQQNSASRFTSQNIRTSLMSRATPTVGVAGVNQRNFLSSSSGNSVLRSKPFSGVSRGPTVSPYLALSAPRASASDYYNVIRPQQQQRSNNQRQQMRQLQQQRRLNQLAARAPFSTTGDENRAPTGHAAVFQSLGSFQNTGGYFPPPSRPKQR